MCLIIHVNYDPYSCIGLYYSRETAHHVEQYGWNSRQGSDDCQSQHGYDLKKQYTIIYKLIYDIIWYILYDFI